MAQEGVLVFRNSGYPVLTVSKSMTKKHNETLKNDIHLSAVIPPREQHNLVCFLQIFHSLSKAALAAGIVIAYCMVIGLSAKAD